MGVNIHITLKHFTCKLSFPIYSVDAAAQFSAAGVTWQLQRSVMRPICRAAPDRAFLYVENA